MIQSVQLSAWAMGVGLMAATLDPKKHESTIYTQPCRDSNPQSGMERVQFVRMKIMKVVREV